MHQKLPHGRPRGRPRRPQRTTPPHRAAELERQRAWKNLPAADRARMVRDLNGVMPDGRLAGQPPSDNGHGVFEPATRKADPQQPLF